MQGAIHIFRCQNAFIDGLIINDFNGDEEAISYGADYEASVYRIDPGGAAVLIYTPAREEAKA